MSMNHNDDSMFSIVSPEVPRSAKGRRRGTTEHASFADNGCEMSPTCLSCPLALCKYDDPDWRRRHDIEARDAHIVELRSGGMPVNEISAMMEVSDRTVYRVLLRAKRLAEREASEAGGRRPRFDWHAGGKETAVMPLDLLEQWRPVPTEDDSQPEADDGWLRRAA